MQEVAISYSCDNVNLKGFLYHHPKILGKRPGIIVAHAWRGIDAYDKNKAKQLAELGYVVLAADVYGFEKPAQNDQEAFERMLPLFLDRALLQKRITAAYEVLKKQKHVDAERIGAIGFCFGGLTAIELLRSGTPIRGAVSFHGVLGDKIAEHKAKTVPIAKEIKGSLLVLHGHDDPLVSSADIAAFQKEMTDHCVDWQMHVYGHTSHAFTNQEALESDSGLMYNERADLRSWRSMQNFFSEIF